MSSSLLFSTIESADSQFACLPRDIWREIIAYVFNKGVSKQALFTVSPHHEKMNANLVYIERWTTRTYADLLHPRPLPMSSFVNRRRHRSPVHTFPTSRTFLPDPLPGYTHRPCS